MTNEKTKKVKVQKVWTKEDVKDFFSDFLNLNIDDVNSAFRVSRDFEDSLIDGGMTHTQQVSDMGEGVEKFLRETILKANDLI
ncbi:MAG: hypothetical protein RLY43_703 [Bacteroidota bacterium]